MSFLVFLYLITGMSLFTYRIYMLKSLGILGLIIDAMIKEIKDKTNIEEKDIPIAKEAIVVVLGLFFILTWPIILIMERK